MDSAKGAHQETQNKLSFTLEAAGTQQKLQHNPENCPLWKKISEGQNCGISLFLAQERNSEAADDLKWVLKRKEGRKLDFFFFFNLQNCLACVITLSMTVTPKTY